MSDPKIIALIPARGGSQRIPRKNIRQLGDRPLIAYTIAAAKASGIFSGIFVSTEDEEIGRTALAQGGVCWIRRPSKMAASSSPDIEWIEHALEFETSCSGDFQAFAILRPTSPFRKAYTIRRAWAEWLERGGLVDSLRAMQPVTEHPGKMWVHKTGDQQAYPFCDFDLKNPPAHSRPTQSLKPIYVQNASLEIAWTKTVEQLHSISGDRVMPFLSEGYEGFDLNSWDDWILAEALIERGYVDLPEVA